MSAQPSHKSVIATGLYILSTFLLTLGFYQNQWGTYDSHWFDSVHDAADSWIVGRLAESRQEGVFAGGGLTGFINGYTGTPQDVETQFDAYLNQTPVTQFVYYYSQPAGQGMVMSTLDALTPFTPIQNLVMFRWLEAILSASVLGLLTIWFYFEFGWASAVTVMVGEVLSSSLPLFGRSLWWILWAYYVPMLACLSVLVYEVRAKRSAGYRLALAVFAGLMLKYSLNGYEYITTTLVMLTVPLIYFAFRDRWPSVKLVQRLGVAVVSALGATLLSVTLLAAQVAVVTGSYTSGLAHVLERFVARTGGSSATQAVTPSEPIPFTLPAILWRYLNQVVMDAQFVPPIKVVDLIIGFLLVTAIAWWATHRQPVTWTGDNKVAALAIATWFSILAPLSWIVIFLQHAYEHIELDHIVWYMPFFLFGFALCGFVAEKLSLNLISLRSVKRSTT